jgi:hypothetical protein
MVGSARDLARFTAITTFNMLIYIKIDLFLHPCNSNSNSNSNHSSNGNNKEELRHLF